MSNIKHLRHWRERAGLTQFELADALSVDETTIRRWEYGKFEPKARNIKKLCEVLNVSETELLNGPAKQEWKLEMITNLNEVIKMSIDKDKPMAELHVKENGLAITLAAAIDLWKDDNAFESLIEQLRAKRAMGLRNYEEGWA